MNQMALKCISSLLRVLAEQLDDNNQLYNQVKQRMYDSTELDYLEELPQSETTVKLANLAEKIIVDHFDFED